MPLSSSGRPALRRAGTGIFLAAPNKHAEERDAVGVPVLGEGTAYLGEDVFSLLANPAAARQITPKARAT
jgi:hypothetical protein